MAIELICSCGKKLRVGDDKAGRKGKCPACGALLDIPGEKIASAAEAKPPAAIKSNVAGAPRPSAAPASTRPVSTGPATDRPASAAPAPAPARSPASAAPAPAMSRASSGPPPATSPAPAKANSPGPRPSSRQPKAETGGDDFLLDLESAVPPPPDPDALAAMAIAEAPRPTGRRPSATPPVPQPVRPGAQDKFAIHRGKSKRAARPQGAGPLMHVQIPTTYLILGGIAILIAAFAYFVVNYPMKAAAQWNVAQKQGDDAINSVITRAMQAFLATQGAWDPRNAHWLPQVTQPPEYFVNPVMIEMPEKVGFVVVTSEGKVGGFFNTHTGEVEADMTLLNTPLKVTGEEKNGDVEAFINGKPAIIPTPPDQ